MVGKERRQREFIEAVLASLRGIEAQLHTLTAALKPIQKQEDPESATDSASEEEAFPQPSAALSIITEPSEREAKQHKAEYQKQNWLQLQALRAQRHLLAATLAAFGAAAYYAWTSKRQLNTMNETLKEAHIQNVAQQRADLDIRADSSASGSSKITLQLYEPRPHGCQGNFLFFLL
jgi:hypothetical protein